MDENKIDYAMSDLDIKSNMSDKDINALIDSLCNMRMENSDVVLMDNIINSTVNNNYDPVAQEKYELEQDKIAIENDIMRSIFENTTSSMDIEEYNMLKAKGIYDKYVQSKNIENDNGVMNSIENEIKMSISNNPIPGDIIEEQAIESISRKEVSEENNNIFQEPISIKESIISNENKDAVNIQEDSEQILNEMTSSEGDNIMNNDEFSKSVFGFPSMVRSIADYSKNLPDESKELCDVIDEVVSNKQDNTNIDIENLNDVPATELEVPTDALTKSLLDQYDGVTLQDAMQLIDVMNRYKAKEKFNVFEALPKPIKTEILKEAASVGADKSMVNFFAKTFINDLVNNTFLDKEINDFNAELQEALAPMENIVGTMMDEYNDEVYEKFNTVLREKANEIKDTDPEKSNQLIIISKNFNDAVYLTRIIDSITNNPVSINRAYKAARDNWNSIVNKYNDAVSNLNPRPRQLDLCLKGIMDAGFPEDYAKTIAVLAKDSILKSIESKTLEEHVYAYYLSNSLSGLSYTANNSKITIMTTKGLNLLISKIDEYMSPLKARNSKKNRKRNKRK